MLKLPDEGQGASLSSTSYNAVEVKLSTTATVLPDVPDPKGGTRLLWRLLNVAFKTGAGGSLIKVNFSNVYYHVWSSLL